MFKKKIKKMEKDEIKKLDKTIVIKEDNKDE